MQGAWKVGILVVIFISMLLGAYAILGNNVFEHKSVRYYADFKDANGVSAGTQVVMAGVEIGKVERVDLANFSTARLTLAIEPRYFLPRGSIAEIQGSLTGLGTSPVVIVPPVGRKDVMLPPRSVLRGESPSPIETYLPGAKQTINQLNKTLYAAQQLLQDEQLKGGLAKLIDTSTKTVQQFGLVAERADSLIGQNQTTINRAVASAATAMEDIQKSSAILVKFAQDPRWRTQTVALLDNLNTTSKKAANLVQNLNDLVTDPKIREPIDQTVANTEKITDTGTRIAANTETMSKNGIVMTQNGVEMTKKALEIEDKAKTLEDSAKGVLDKLQGVFGFKKSAPPLLAGITGSLDFLRETHPGHTRTDLNVAIPIKNDILHLGLYDAFESNKINAEWGTKFGKDNEYMYGIYASKPAVGVDYRLASRLFLRGDFYNINDPRLDLRARVEFGSGFYGWLGLEQVFKYNAPVIGIGFRR